MTVSSLILSILSIFIYAVISFYITYLLIKQEMKERNIASLEEFKKDPSYKSCYKECYTSGMLWIIVIPMLPFLGIMKIIEKLRGKRK